MFILDVLHFGFYSNPTPIKGWSLHVLKSKLSPPQKGIKIMNKIMLYFSIVIVVITFTPPVALSNNTGELVFTEVTIFRPSIGQYNFVRKEKIGTDMKFRIYAESSQDDDILLHELTNSDFGPMETAVLSIPSGIRIFATFQYTIFGVPEFRVLAASTDTSNSGSTIVVLPENMSVVFYQPTTFPEFQPIVEAIRNLRIAANIPQ